MPGNFALVRGLRRVLGFSQKFTEVEQACRDPTIVGVFDPGPNRQTSAAHR